MAIALSHHFQIPIITVEFGGAQKIYPDFQKTGLQGIRNVLILTGMTSGQAKIPARQYVLPQRYGVHSSESALIQFSVKLGALVHVGQEIGELYFPQNIKIEKITSPICGRIFSLWGYHQVKKDKIIFSILEEKKCHIKRTTLDKFQQLPQLSVKRISL